MTNPLYGYRIKSIKALEEGTEVQVIDNQLYKRFLSGKTSKWVDYTDKELLNNFIKELSIQDAK